MARPRSDDKRSAILAAAIHVISAHGLGAATATIAKEAGVSNGSFFTYFETKSEMFNQLYLELKAGMASAAMAGVPGGSELREDISHAWANWMEWAVANPEQRSALAQLGVSDEITPETRAAGHKTMAGIAQLLERVHAHGSLRDAPMKFVVAIMNSLAEATIDFMVQEPSNAKNHCEVGFEALWRVMA